MTTLLSRSLEWTLSEIETELRDHPILAHLFLSRLKQGELTRSQIGLWVSQQFYFSNQFPRCLAAVYARMADFELSRPLMAFLSVEHWGSDEEGAHWKQFRDVLGFFGLRIEELKGRPPFPETKAYLDYRLNLCLHASVEEALGAMGFGHELVNEQIFAAYLAGVEKIPGATDDALRYFRAHVEDEPADFEIFRKIILGYAHTEEQLALVRKGALDVLNERTIFFDRLYERLV